MPDLGDFHRALSVAAAKGGKRKVYFYVAANEEAALRHGTIFILDSESCLVQFENKESNLALREIPKLSFIKIDTMEMLSVPSNIDASATLDIQHVLNLLDPALQPRQAAPQQAAPVTPAPSVPTPPQPANFMPAPPQAEPTAAVAQATAGSPANSGQESKIKDLAQGILVQYFGSSAQRKIDTIAVRYDPLTNPIGFLNECENAIALLIGKQKASEVFKHLIDLVYRT